MATYSVRLRSGATMPLIGLGTFLSKSEVTTAAVLKAIEVGYRMIDTAYVYENEEAIGEALKIAFEKKIVTREELFITTKLPCNGHAKVEYFLKQSLAKLQLSYVDLYLIHFPQGFKYTTDEDYWGNKGTNFDSETTHIDTWKAMEACVDAGLVKNIGLSNFNSKQIKNVYDQARIKPCNLQVECHIFFQQEKLYNFCKSLGITMTAYSPFGSPEVSARDFKDGEARPKVLEDPILTELAKKYNKTTGQIALRWFVQRGIVAIPKSNNPSRIEENFQAFDFLLTEDEMNRIKGQDIRSRVFEFTFIPNLAKLPNFPFHDEF